MDDGHVDHSGANGNSGGPLDFVTLLEALPLPWKNNEVPRLTKTFFKDKNGETKLRDYDNGYEFRVTTARLDDGLVGLRRVLETLTRHQAVIPGAPLPDTNCDCTRRISSEKHYDKDKKTGALTHVPPTFGDAAHPWLPFDFDQVGEYIADPDAAVAYLRTLLPPELREVDLLWQLTAGAGWKPGNNMRLWVWLDRAITSEEAGRWLEPWTTNKDRTEAPLDPSMYQPGRLIYGKPVFDDGIANLVPQRFGFSTGSARVVAVPPIPDKPPPREGRSEERSGERSEERGGGGSGESGGREVALETLRFEATHINPNRDRNGHDGWTAVVSVIANTRIIGEDDPARKTQIVAEKRKLVHAFMDGLLYRDPYTPPENAQYRDRDEVDRIFDTAENGQYEFRTIERLARKAGRYNPSRVFDGFRVEQGGSAEWPKPGSPYASATHEPLLKFGSLPRVVADYAWDEGARKGLEPAALAMPMAVANGMVFHPTYRLQPRQFDTTWVEYAILWGANASPVSSMKTSALNVATEPMQKIDHEWRDAADRRRLAAEYDAALDKQTGAIRQVPIDPNNLPEPRLFAGNATMESLHDMLAKTGGRGLIWMRDELSSLLGGLDAYRGRGVTKDQGDACEMWNGGRYTIDRKGSRSLRIPYYAAAILGNIPPKALGDLVYKNGMADNGMLQRLLVWSALRETVGEDRLPNEAARSAYHEMVRTLAGLEAEYGRPPIVLASEARSYWDEVCNLALSMELMPGTSTPLKGFLGKVPGHFARTLLVFHMIEAADLGAEALSLLGVPSEVSGATAQRARDMMVQFLIPSAAEVYGALFQEEADDLRRAARLILAEERTTITDNMLQQATRAFRGGPAAAARRAEAMEGLVGIGWLRAEGPFGPWRINPRVYVEFAKKSQREQEREAKRQARVTQAAETIARAYPDED